MQAEIEPEGEILTPRLTPWWKMGVVAGVGCVVAVLVMVGLTEVGERAKTTDVEHAISNARQLVEKHLKAPSTARYLSSDVVDRQGDYFLVHVIVEAKNEFGVPLRNSLCVVVGLTRDRKKFVYDTKNSVQECSDPPPEAEMSLMKRLNGWPTVE